MLPSWARVLVLVLTACLGCGDDDSAGCVDRDGDRFGVGCEAGADCDDDNAARNVDCVGVPPPDCVADPLQTGCPCLAGATTGCYGGPEETAGVGVCVTGNALCVNSHWGLCDGATLPRGEICDTRDNDCDGVVDDGVLSPCGACTPGCNGAVWGEADRPFEPAPGLALGPLGELTLAFEERVAGSTVWVANSAEATVSRIDAASAVETARYRTGGLEPSRVAVDYAGDAWIANREFDGTSTLIKIAGALERCVDADGDGTVETSTGPTDVRDFGADECVLLHLPVGGPGGVARALAIDGDLGLDGTSGGNAWVGLHDGEEVVLVDGLTGDVRERVATPGFQPYAASFDPWGTLWVASRDGHVARIDRMVRPLVAEIAEVPFACFLLYSLAVDRGGRLFMTGFSCDTVVSHDPSTGAWRQRQIDPSTRGVAVLDGEPWVSHTGGLVSRLDPTLSVLDLVDLSSDGIMPVESIGVGVDAFDRIWIASSRGGAGGVGLATRVDPSDGAIAHVPVGVSPHTQGDLTGAELVGGFAPEGTASTVFDGCPLDGETDWLRVHVVADPGAAGAVEVSARHAPSAAELDAATFVVLGTMPADPSPLDLDVPDGGALEVRLRLATAARDGAPRVRRVGIEWGCPGPG